MKRTTSLSRDTSVRKSPRVTNRTSRSVADLVTTTSSPVQCSINPTKATNLCLSCAKINLEDLFAQSDPRPVVISRSGSNVLRNQAGGLSCRLCRFVADCIRVFPRSVCNTSLVNQNRLSIVKNTSGKPWYNVAGIDAKLENSPTAWLRFGRSRSQEHYDSHICVSKFDTDVRNYSLPRRRPAIEVDTCLINYELVRAWINICQRSHTSECGRSTNFKRQLLNIRLIDVASREVVLDTARAPYVALSYVWGAKAGVDKASGFMAELPPLSPKLRQSGSVYKLPKVLPKTVEDTLNCVWALGKRYVWIDLYCIDQYNKDEQQTQIEDMDLVYQCADLTLVALDGEDMDSGLAGISRPLKYTEQPIFENEGLHLVATYVESMWDRQATTPWDGRAWTFQEGVLSRRCLYFDRSHIFWRCQEEMFHDTMEVNQHHTRTKTDQNDDLFWENGFGLNVQQVEWSFSTFDTFLSNYTRRGMSDQLDVLRACKGLFNQITRNTGVSFLWGLPLSDFSRAVLWRPHHENCVRERSGFPSWSWVGWRGHIEYSYWLDEMDSYAKEIEIERFRLGPKALEIECNIDDLIRISAKLDKRSPVLQNDEAFLQTKGMSETSGYTLRVSSTIARFKLHRVRQRGELLKHVTKDMQQDRGAQGDQWTLLDRLGNSLVNEVGDHPWFEITDYFFHLEPEYSERLQGQTGASELLFIKYWPAIRDQHTVGNWRYDMVSALLICRREDHTATRLASVVMKLDDWLAAEPQPAIIDLV